MTVVAAIPRVVYAGNGVAASFSVADGNGNPIFFAANSEIQAQTLVPPAGGATSTVTTNLIEGTDYTLTGAGSSTAGTLALLHGPLPTGTRLVIWRQTVLDQLVALGVNSSFSTSAVNGQFDRDRRIDQEIADTISRALLSDRAGLAVDARGQRITNAADGLANTDVVTVEQANALLGSAGNVDAAKTAAQAAATTAQATLKAIQSIVANPGFDVAPFTVPLDDISGSFNGTQTTFNLALVGVAKIPASASQLLVHVGGSFQRAGIAYTVSSSHITFSQAPLAGWVCSILLLQTLDADIPGTLALYATLASPAFTGTPTAPTASAGDNSIKLATTAYVDGAVSTETTARTSAVTTEATTRASADTTLATNLANEISRATTAEGTKLAASTAANSLKGNNTGSTAAAVDLNASQVKTLLGIAESDVSGLVSDLAAKAPLASPGLTGTPTSPTASALTSTTQIATTAYADAATAVEKTRALAAEALLLPLVGGTMTGAITLAADPVSSLQPATKAYTDALVQKQAPKGEMRLATAAALPAYTYSNGASGVGATLTGNATGVLTIDGQTVALNDPIAVLNETAGNAPYNGLYTCTTAGAGGVAYVLTRATNHDVSAEFVGAQFTVGNAGTANANSIWQSSNSGAVTVGTTAVTFTQLNKGTDLQSSSSITISGNTPSVATGGVTNAMLVGSIAASKLTGTDIATVGTITAGTWNGTLIGATYGGTGVNNGASTLTLAGSVTHAGAFTQTITATATTAVTLPTSGTLVSSVTALAGAVSGTPSSTTYLRGDGTWATVNGAPAGSSGQFQYDNAGAFGGANLWQGTNLIEQYNGTTAQKTTIYNTRTDASNYERGVFDWSTTANVLRIGAEAAGTGTQRAVQFIGSQISFGLFTVTPSVNSTGTNNSAQGVYALQNNTTGGSNTAQGVYALQNNTTGGSNTAQGVSALYSNTTGASNTAQGVSALQNNTTGGGNSAQGQSALYNNTTGVNNSAQGVSALFYNTTGANNSAQGVSALQNNTTGGGNSAQGVSALQNNTTGGSNTAQGASALYSNTTGGGNSAQGVSALQNNTTGASNSAQGASALQNNTTGGSNTAQGASALFYNTTGTNNSAQGVSALYDLGSSQTAGAFNVGTSYTIKTVGTTDFTLIGASANTVGIVFTATGAGTGTGTATPNATNNNTAVGYNTGRGIIYGTGNTILGANVTGLAAGLTNAIILADGTGTKRLDYGVTTASRWTTASPLSVSDIYTTSTAFMHRIAASISAGGTSSVPTITAGPVAGNPTKWIPIDDNGTTRYVPSW